jgi:phytoene dehydrogenase-like protein
LTRSQARKLANWLYKRPVGNRKKFAVATVRKAVPHVLADHAPKGEKSTFAALDLRISKVMSPLVHRIPSDEKLPAMVDVVVIGGGIIGAAAAYFLSKRRLTVALVEKGWIGGEQSSRNWGWCRQQNRDPRELPLAMKGMQLWDRLGEEIGKDLGFRRSGLVYATTSSENMAQWERWRTIARQFGVDTRMLSAAEAKAMTPGSTADWIGGVYSPPMGRLNRRAQPLSWHRGPEATERSSSRTVRRAGWISPTARSLASLPRRD